jgi:hypothetical protein
VIALMMRAKAATLSEIIAGHPNVTQGVWLRKHPGEQGRREHLIRPRTPGGPSDLQDHDLYPFDNAGRGFGAYVWAMQ